MRAATETGKQRSKNTVHWKIEWLTPREGQLVTVLPPKSGYSNINAVIYPVYYKVVQAAEMQTCSSYLECFWSWDCRRNFTKCETFILWQKRKDLHHLTRQKMNWAGRKRNWCLEQRSKGFLCAMNIAIHCPSLRGAAGIFVAFSRCDPQAWYINAYIAVLDFQGHSGHSCLLSGQKGKKITSLKLVKWFDGKKRYVSGKLLL